MAKRKTRSTKIAKRAAAKNIRPARRFIDDYIGALPLTDSIDLLAPRIGGLLLAAQPMVSDFIKRADACGGQLCYEWKRRAINIKITEFNQVDAPGIANQCPPQILVEPKVKETIEKKVNKDYCSKECSDADCTCVALPLSFPVHVKKKIVVYTDKLFNQMAPAPGKKSPAPGTWACRTQMKVEFDMEYGGYIGFCAEVPVV